MLQIEVLNQNHTYIRLQSIQMIFQEESEQAACELTQAVISQEQKRMLSEGTKTIHFSTIVKFFNRFTSMRGVKKTLYAKQFIKLLFKNNRNPTFTYSVIRLLLPDYDKNRGNYGLKEKTLAKIVSQSLTLQKEDYDRLYHFKNPSYHKNGIGIGDFSVCVFDVVQKFCKEKSDLNIQDLNILLDELASSSKTQVQIFRKFFSKSNAQEIKWIIRIILKDLKIGLKIETILQSFHCDANDYFNLTNSLVETCKKFENPHVSLNDEIKLFCPIRPMLAGKKKIAYFKDQSERTFFVETKFDGERLQVHKSKDQIKMFSRNGVDYTQTYADLTFYFKNQIESDSCILDGEVIVIEKESHKMAAFGLNKVVALNKQCDEFQLCYKVFDLLWLRIEDEEINMMKVPLRQRKDLLQKLIKEVKGKIEVVKHQEMSEYDEIVKTFSESIENNEEGIMLKDPNSLYMPKERGASWLKLKGDYIDGLTDTLDLIILGGYYGNSSSRHGSGTHWTDQITSFLVGVIDKIDSLNSNIAYAIPFAKVGTGYTMDQLALLREKLKDNLIRNEGKTKPSFLQNIWKHSLHDRPDCWISNLSKSLVVEVKAAEIIKSDSYPIGHTLRFPRVVKIRYDKDWNQTISNTEFEEMLNNSLYTKNMKRKLNDSDSDQEKEEIETTGLKGTKKRKADEEKNKKSEVMEEFIGFSMDNERLVSHLFHGFKFSVLPLEGKQERKIDVQRDILLNDGEIMQNPSSRTNFIVANRIDFRLRAYQSQANCKFTFVKPNYIRNCLKANRMLGLSPIYLTVLPSENVKFYMQEYDKYGDSYTAYVDLRELDEVLGNMDDDKTYIRNEKLEREVSLHYRRRDKVSFCFGVNEVDQIKLQMHGNKFVHSLQHNPNSILIARDLTESEYANINEYKRENQLTSIEYLHDLIANHLL